MVIKIGDFEFTEVWDGVFYKKLSDYPEISDWELRTIIEFIEYEKAYGRECVIECDDRKILNLVNESILHKDMYLSTPRPKLLTECTACPYRKGCVTDYVCHTTSADNAIKIFECGKLLSALNARKVSIETLMNEGRNAANDPADYFEYIMFAWGNCQAGDRLVMERSLGRFPNDKDLSIGFNPGVRFYFHYEQLILHPSAICDGVLPMKVKDEIILDDWVYKIVIPTGLKAVLEPYVPANLIERECKKGNIKPKANPEEIMQYVAAVYSGIEMNCITSACYNHGPVKINYEPRKLFKVHAKAMIMLLGGEI